MMIEIEMRDAAGRAIASVEIRVLAGHGAYRDLHALDVALAESRGGEAPTLQDSKSAAERFPILHSIDPVGDRVFAAEELEALACEIDEFIPFLHGPDRGAYRVFRAIATTAPGDGFRVVAIGD